MAKEPIEPSLDDQLKALELEERKQALEARKIQDQLNRLQLGKLQQEVETIKSNKERGIADARKAIEDRKAGWDRCNHHLGGEGALAITNGQGDMERPTCVSGIQFLDESIMLRCNRCGKKWHNSYPNGNEDYGVWAEGVNLFKRSQFKNISIVGGVKVQKQVAVA